MIVAALSTLVVAYTLPEARRLWHAPGVVGFVADFDNVISEVAASPAAMRAGINDGDRIDIARTPPESRAVAADAGVTAEPGQRVTFAIVHGSQERMVTLTTGPYTLSPTEKVLLVGRLLAMLLFVGIGTSLVLLRPSNETWGFYFYCLGLNGAATVMSAALVGPPWNWIILTIAEVVLPAAAFIGVLLFALCFLHTAMRGWRGAMYRLTPLIFVILCGLEVYAFFGQNWFGWPAQAAGNFLSFLQVVVALIAMFALLATYVAARGSDRQRIRWVVLAFAIALAAAVVSALPIFIGVPYWLYATFQLVGVVVPIAVAYAVIKHRVIDVSLVVSRTLVYTVLTTLLVGALSIIDWFFIEKLRLVRLGTIAEVAAAVAIGFWFNGLHRRVDAFIDAVFFRQRHRAEVRLGRAVAALPTAPTTAAIAHFLVDEAVDALQLASAALFRRRPDGAFIREQASGWGSEDILQLGDSDTPLLMLLQTATTPLPLYDYQWRTEGLPPGAARPVLALPIVVRREVTGVVFYGSHVHGEPLDPDEIRALNQLPPAAAVAYDHLNAESMRREVEQMRAEVEKLRSTIAELQIQPT